MLKTNRYISIFTIIIAIFFLSSCGALVKSKAKKYATVEAGAIPADFGADGAGVLFATYQRSYNKYLKKNIKKVYHGPHTFMSPQDSAMLKYIDTVKYRYIFSYDRKHGQRYSNNTVIHGPGGGMSTYSVRQFYIKDLKTDSIYKLGMTSGLWSKLQRFYLKELEAQRMLNQNQK